MVEDKIIDLLAGNFPERKTLSYEEFICKDESGLRVKDVFGDDYHDVLLKRVYSLISSPWAEIYWPEIADIDSNCWMLPSFLNERSFIHAFPSLLKFLYVMPTMREDKISSISELLIGNFLDQLNFNEIKEGWKRDFYTSSREEVKRLIYQILFFAKERYDSFYGIEKVLTSYWILFA